MEAMIIQPGQQPTLRHFAFSPAGDLVWFQAEHELGATRLQPQEFVGYNIGNFEKLWGEE